MKPKTISGPITIILHALAWLGLIIIVMISLPEYPDSLMYSLVSLLSIVAQLAVFYYLNYLLLIPKLLVRRKMFLYLLMSALLFMFSLLIFNIIGIYLMQPPSMQSPSMHHGMHPEHHEFFHIRGISMFFITWVLSTGMKMTSEWYKNERQKKELENDKIKAEFAMLKAQINPHFFFNVLNNICSLARSKSDETESYIIKLSELLRYNIYDQKEEKVSLAKEVHFIANFIDIQKMRLTDNVKVTFFQSGNFEQQMIEPMLLFPFVENAFKHGISYSDPSSIDIDIHMDRNELIFTVNNSINPNADMMPEKDEGIGLKNVKRRLHLVYPDKHTLVVKQSKNEFSILLKIKLIND